MEIATTRSLHPLTAIAAVSVTIFSLVGIGAITGLIPTSHSQAQAVRPAEDPAQPAAAAQTSVAASTAISPGLAEKIAVHRAAPRSAKTVKRAAKTTEEPVKAAGDSAPITVAQNDPAPAMTPPPPPAVATPPKPICYDCGVIESVREVEKKGEGSGLGAVAGGVAGGLLGHQTGGGRGRDVMTVLGAIGGAFAGHEVEKNVKKVKSYEIAIRFEDGSNRLISQENPPAWRTGDRVRLVNGVISANNG